jgi:hypothetical protein
MSDENGKDETKKEKRKRLNKMIKKEAKKDLKPKMGEIREFEAKTKKKKRLK